MSKKPTIGDPAEPVPRYEIALPISEMNGAAAIGRRLLLVYEGNGDELELVIGRTDSTPEGVRVKVDGFQLMQAVDVLRPAMLSALPVGPIDGGAIGFPPHVHRRPPWIR